MKTRILNPLSIVILFIAPVKETKAYSTIFNDTTKNEWAIVINKPNKALTNIKKANVVYPSILTGHEKQTLEYIERFSINRRAYLLRTFNKGKKFFPKISSIFKKFNLPQEFNVLMALESAFNPNAASPAGAVGYWQIMDPVAKEYGLKIPDRNPDKTIKPVKKTGKKKQVIDERKNFTKSTFAAARYLKDRSRNLDNNCLLIVASYNWGVGNVWNAMQKTGKKSPTFWDIKKYLPSETKAYVMNFITLNVIFHNYENFLKNQLTFQDRKIEKAMNEDYSAFIGPVPQIDMYF